eukprot:TRINITY_DN5799_c0_g1_i6.p4 TRINITY_DN5799_c0_g1~~TRINITY_DN5799_c0_g1_i6.p4  ORF type:complete len:230 (-),score=-25.67 TRINITY_DN5799_c0_g1_i6:1609-2298(-)
MLGTNYNSKILLCQQINKCLYPIKIQNKSLFFLLVQMLGTNSILKFYCVTQFFIYIQQKQKQGIKSKYKIWRSFFQQGIVYGILFEFSNYIFSISFIYVYNVHAYIYYKLYILPFFEQQGIAYSNIVRIIYIASYTFCLFLNKVSRIVTLFELYIQCKHYICLQYTYIYIANYTFCLERFQFSYSTRFCLWVLRMSKYIYESRFLVQSVVRYKQRNKRGVFYIYCLLVW